jgi:Stage II sporulation protein E (SpoIIE)/GAF domain
MPTGEEERVAALHARQILDTPAEERFDRVTRLARRLFDVDEALVSLIDRTRQWTKSTSRGSAACGGQVPREDSFCHTTITYEDGVIVEDALLDDRFKDNPYVACADPIRFYAGMPISTAGQHVGTLCLVDHRPRSITDADIALLRDLAGWVEKELNLDSELERAAEVQRALLPSTNPTDAHWDITGGCRPSRDVGGDFYDWYSNDPATTVVLADVMGKGMPAAIVAATARAALRSGADASPAATLEQASAILAPDLAATGTFVAAFVATLEPDGHLSYADAGHGYAGVLRSDGTTTALGPGRPPIGIDVGATPEPGDHHLTLAPGDLLVIHSDGLLELPFGPRTTDQLLGRLRGATSADDALARIDDIVGSQTPSDDTTVLIARRRDQSGAC